MTHPAITFPTGALTGSPFSTIHNARGRLAQALASVPAWRDAGDRLTKVPRPSTAPVAAPYVTVADALVAALYSDDELPNLAAVATKAMNAQAAATTVRDAIGHATMRLRSDLDAALRNHVDDVLRNLHRQLTDVIESVAGIANPMAFATGDVTEAAERPDDARRFTAAASAHNEIRNAQALLYRTVLEQPVSSFEHPARVLRNIEQHNRDYAVTHLQHRSGIRPHDTKRVRAPWPRIAQDIAGLPMREATTPAFFAWAIANDAGLWVPDSLELLEETNRADAAVARPAPGAEYVRRDQLDRGPMFEKGQGGMRRPVSSASR